MRLDRNTNPDGRGKYALIKLREISNYALTKIKTDIIHISGFPREAIDFGDTPDTEFFVIRLKDKYAANALHAYAASCSTDDPEFSREVRALALRSADMSNKQKPT